MFGKYNNKKSHCLTSHWIHPHCKFLAPFLDFILLRTRGAIGKLTIAITFDFRGYYRPLAIICTRSSLWGTTGFARCRKGLYCLVGGWEVANLAAVLCPNNHVTAEIKGNELAKKKVQKRRVRFCVESSRPGLRSWSPETERRSWVFCLEPEPELKSKIRRSRSRPPVQNLRPELEL